MPCCSNLSRACVRPHWWSWREAYEAFVDWKGAHGVEDAEDDAH